MRAVRRGLLLGLLAGLLLPACGKKGPPVAPERRLPAAAAGLQGAVDERAIVLTWANPRTRVDGTPLRDLTVVRLHRREEPEGAAPKPAILAGVQVVGYEEIAAIRMAAPAPAVAERGQVRWVDRERLAFGRQYVYVVTAEDSIGRSGAPSERLSVTFLPAPGAPRGLTAEPGDGQVRLRWEPPGEFIDGSPASGEIRYVILRGPEGAAALAPVTPAPVAGTAYTDTGLENDTPYRYAVRAVRMDPRASATGPAAAPVTASPVDVTPPSPPGNLVAIPAPGAVRLAWNPSPEQDVALYAVYRAAGAGEFVRIATTAAVTTVFTDRDARPGTAYRYVVTALDRARRANESARSNEVQVTVPQ